MPTDANANRGRHAPLRLAPTSLPSALFQLFRVLTDTSALREGCSCVGVIEPDLLSPVPFDAALPLAPTTPLSPGLHAIGNCVASSSSMRPVKEGVGVSGGMRAEKEGAKERRKWNEEEGGGTRIGKTLRTLQGGALAHSHSGPTAALGLHAHPQLDLACLLLRSESKRMRLTMAIALWLRQHARHLPL
ncbi:hypothetical protein K439DRAFT_570963 [Ramaria rubella]|nr:hypothetical protein K439DRAFT_570963 [Ramaria rubella]